MKFVCEIFGGLRSGARFNLAALILLSAPLFIALTGCAPVTSTARYGEKPKSEPRKETVTERYKSPDTTTVKPSFENPDLIDEESDTEDYIPSSQRIKIEQVLAQYDTLKKYKFSDPAQANFLDNIFMQIIKWYETPYKYGGTSTKGIDCSAFTQTVYKSAFNISLLRSAREQYTQGTVIDDFEDLEPGDLVFFNTRRRVRPGHVGIYIGDRLFAHASTKLGVTVSSLDENYYNSRYMGARRVFDLATGQRTGN
ncbi:MAG: C40 family peptidase [Ignavibacteriaceae bacterium]|nr:C40 family peptidase [Ignavibacteriaceae bacterium]